jgi:hypothetical protein
MKEWRLCLSLMPFDRNSGLSSTENAAVDRYSWLGIFIAMLRPALNVGFMVLFHLRFDRMKTPRSSSSDRLSLNHHLAHPAWPKIISSASCFIKTFTGTSINLIDRTHCICLTIRIKKFISLNFFRVCYFWHPNPPPHLLRADITTFYQRLPGSGIRALAILCPLTQFN